ncbi:hypothetical protein DdX_04518 [Ditylenchus destructor]|uniref:Uncharacterized protein n=1 Tax=Ditylenchus destructor TaxID=166010 RepID=A0AAD4R4L0_9BILA|nr:hypothetical protein DdX_04518 [Ditylenchus destructor]
MFIHYDRNRSKHDVCQERRHSSDNSWQSSMQNGRQQLHSNSAITHAKPPGRRCTEETTCARQLGHCIGAASGPSGSPRTTTRPATTGNHMNIG